jgi:CRP-like cAMP-binding protein
MNAAQSPEKSIAGLPKRIADALFLSARMVQLTAQQTLFIAGDPGDGCYLVDEGLLKAYIVSAAGGERILAIFGPGALVGELSIIDGAPRSASVTALRTSKLRFLSRAAFEATAAGQPEIYQHLMVLLAHRLREIDEALTATGFLPLQGRAARALLSLAEAFGKDVGSGRVLIQQKVSQSDLAAMAGIARENVSRILQDWMRRSLVSRLSGYYCVEDRKALERECAR